MSSRSVLFTANAGFFLTVGHITLAVDAFPRQADRGFSALSEENLRHLCTAAELSSTDYAASPSGKSDCPILLPSLRYVIATHDHADHYSRSRTEVFLAEHPSARFIGGVSADRLPQGGSPIQLSGDHHTYYFPGVTLEFQRLEHESAAFSHVPNYGCLATFSGTHGCRVLFPGDAQPADPAIVHWLAGREVDLALLSFPWLTLPRGRAFLKEHLPQAKLAILHLPYESDDRNGYLAAATRAADQWDRGGIRIFERFGQTMEF